MYQPPLRPAPKAFAHGEIYASMNFTPSAGALLKKSALSNCENDNVEIKMRALIKVPNRFLNSLFIAV